MEYNTFDSVLHLQTKTWNHLNPVQSNTTFTFSGTNTHGSVRHLGLNFPPNGKNYVDEWVQSTTMNEKLQSAKPTASVTLNWAAVMKNET